MPDRHKDESEKRTDRFADLARCYDGWINWPRRLRLEIPFLIESLPPGGALIDVGCGTGAHAAALAAAGFRVTGADRSAAMLKRARERAQTSAAGGEIEWLRIDLVAGEGLDGRTFPNVLCLGNTLIALGGETEVRAGLDHLIALVDRGGTLILQYLNILKIRSQGRVALKAHGEGEEVELWLRHQFLVGETVRNHWYLMRRSGAGWEVEFRQEPMAELPPERIRALLSPYFESLEFYDGLTGDPFRPETSDAIGIRARGRR